MYSLFFEGPRWQSVWHPCISGLWRFGVASDDTQCNCQGMDHRH